MKENRSKNKNEKENRRDKYYCVVYSFKISPNLFCGNEVLISIQN